MIRPAVKDDFPQIAKIWNQIIRDTAATFTNAEKEVAELVQANAAGRPFFVAEQEFLFCYSFFGCSVIRK